MMMITIIKGKSFGTEGGEENYMRKRLRVGEDGFFEKRVRGRNLMRVWFGGKLLWEGSV